MREVPKAEGEKKPKTCTIYRKIVQIASCSLPHPSGAPSSEGATKQEPLRLILTCSISTVPTSLRLRGRTPREGRPYGRIGRQFDRNLPIRNSVSIANSGTIHCPLSTVNLLAAHNSSHRPINRNWSNFEHSLLFRFYGSEIYFVAIKTKIKATQCFLFREALCCICKGECIYKGESN